MLVELIGPSGTGKTTTLRALRNSATGQRADFLSYEEYVAEKRTASRSKHGEEPPLLPVITSHPRLALVMLRLALAHGRPWKRRIRKAIRCLLNFAIAESLQREHPDKLIVMDNGYTQVLWSLVVEAPRLRGQALIREALTYYQHAIAPRGVLIKVADEQIIERVFSRQSTGRFNREAGPAARDAYARWISYFHEMISLAPPGLVVAEVNGHLEPDELGSRLSAVIESMDGDPATAN